MFVLPGLHRVDRGAEIAFISIARELARTGNDITLLGSGPERAGEPYRYLRAPAIKRERFEKFPKIPALRSETGWEEASFLPGLLTRFRPSDYDVTVTCAYPFTNWALRRPAFGHRPKHVFVTQNGDWAAWSDNAEFRLFGCDGLVCTNPDYLERNAERYRAVLIPNGVDTSRFRPGEADRAAFGLPATGPIVLMVSALIASKNVREGIEAVAKIPDAVLVVAGDGPLRAEIHDLARQLLPDRFVNLTVTADRMPDLYRTADVFLHLSVDESFGNVFLEAMATGLPVVAYEYDRTRWIVGDEALFADRSDPASLPAKLSAALRANARVKDAMTERAQSFGWPAIAVRYEAFFKELCAL
ncbi:MAG: glycosyltransferase family 4 protein [Sphingomicrobium sp.]